MTTFQKIIKNVAIAFAWFLVVIITSTCFVGLYYFGALLGFDTTEKTKDLQELPIPTTTTNKIKIDLSASSLKIKEGPTLKLESTNSKLEVDEKEEYLVIEENSWTWFQNTSQKQIVLTIPTNKALEYLEIEAGAGFLEIESLKVEKLNLDLGAGKVKIDDLEVYHNADIDGGAGEIEINSNKMNNMELNMGLGKLTLNANIFGNSKIEAGIGEVNINILGNKENYTLKLEKGIGSIKIDNQKVDTTTTYGKGENILSIEGGIGSIDILFQENEEE